MPDYIFDKWGKNLIENSNMTDDEMKSLYHLLNKLDSKSMETGIGWFADRAPEHGEDYPNFYKYAVGNFFAVQSDRFVVINFGDGISEIMNENDHEEFPNHPMIKYLVSTDADHLLTAGRIINTVKEII